MAPHPVTEAEIDEERKTELIMEKRLRACRVNIIPRNGGYFDKPNIPPPVSKRPPKPVVSPTAVEKATNPIALRYWNQCMDKKTERKAQDMTHEKESQSSLSPQMPPWVSSETYHVNIQTAVKPKALTPQLQVKVPDITKRVRSESVPRGVQYNRLRLSLDTEINHHDDPSPMVERRVKQEKVEIVTVLSTAGTGINRNNEVREALGNINRFITTDKVKRDDALRVVNNTQRKISAPTPLTIDTKPYSQIKEDQIKVSMERTNFQNNSKNRIPKPPQPFKGSRQDISEPTIVKKDECQCKQRHQNTNPFGEINSETNMNTFMEDFIPKLNKSQTSQLGVALFRQLSSDLKKDLVSEQISLMSAQDLVSVLSNTSNEVVSRAVPMLFPRTNDDVKLNLVVGTLPDLAPRLKNEMFQDTDRKMCPVSKPAYDIPKINMAEVNMIENSKKTDNDNFQLTKKSKISIPEIRIDKAEEPTVQYKNESPRAFEDEIFQSPACVITQPDIRYDLTDASMEEESSEDDAKKEWEWEDGEELEYEFYEQDIRSAVGTSL